MAWATDWKLMKPEIRMNPIETKTRAVMFGVKILQNRLCIEF